METVKYNFRRFSLVLRQRGNYKLTSQVAVYAVQDDKKLASLALISTQ